MTKVESLKLVYFEDRPFYSDNKFNYYKLLFEKDGNKFLGFSKTFIRKEKYATIPSLKLCFLKSQKGKYISLFLCDQNPTFKDKILRWVSENERAARYVGEVLYGDDIAYLKVAS